MKAIHSYFTTDNSLARVSITFIVFAAIMALAYAVVNEVSVSATDKKADKAVDVARITREQGRAIFERKLDSVLANQEVIRGRQIQDSAETARWRDDRVREIRSLKNTIIAYQKAEAHRLADTFRSVYNIPYNGR